MRLIRTIILIIICLHIGAYLGDTKIKVADTYVIHKAKVCWAWVTSEWNEEEETE